MSTLIEPLSLSRLGAVLLLSLSLHLQSELTFAQSPSPSVNLAYHGELFNAEGERVDGEVTLTVRLYRAPSGGEAVWEERLTEITVQSGILDVTLGLS